MLQEIILVLIISLLLVMLYGSHRFILDKRYRLPPGPLPLPIIGCAYHISDPKKKPWKIFSKLAEMYGPIYTFYIGQLRVVMIEGAEATRKVLISHGKTYNCRADSFMPGFGNAYPWGVISSNGDRWMKLRRLCSKAIRDSGTGQATLVSRIQDEASYILKELDRRVNQTDPIFELVTNAVSNVVCAAVLGKRFTYDDKDFLRLLEVTTIFFDRPFAENAIYLGVPILTKFLVPPQASDLLRVDKVMNSILLPAIEEHRRNFTGEIARDFIDLYIQESQADPTNLPFDAFLGTMRDLLLAGTETTSSAIIWTILYLCKWPAIQRKCQQDIDKVINTNRMPTLEDRPRLVYLDAVMCEILRHVCIVPTPIFHAALDDVNILEGYEIPPCTAISYNTWSMHHDPSYWENPEDFRPERWIDGNGSLLSHSTHFIPFGLGPRSCIGESLARLEYFIFTVAILHRFSFSFPDGCDVDIDTGRYSITHVPPKFLLQISRR